MKFVKLLLTFESLFAGLYLSLTRGLFIIYLVTLGLDIGEISQIVLFATVISSISLIILYRYPIFLIKRIKLKLLLFHSAERLWWLLMILYPDQLTIMISYLGVNISSAVTGSFVNLLIYGMFDEEGVRDITGKRNIAFNAASVLGLTTAILFTAVLVGPAKYALLFTIGIAAGLLSTFSLIPLSVSGLEGKEIPKGVESPENVFSTSLFLLAMMVYGNLMGIVWIPYVVNALGAPDFVAVAMILATTISNIAASVFWSKRRYRDFRTALGTNIVIPASIAFVSLPLLHIAISSISGFFYTGANFLGAFLLARYSKWFGVVRSSIVLGLIGNLAQALAAPIGLVLSNEYGALLLMATLLVVASVILAFITIPEVAFIPDDVARTYSYTLYNSSLMGYSLALESTKETAMLAAKLTVLSVALLAMYVAYRFLDFLIKVLI